MGIATLLDASIDKYLWVLGLVVAYRIAIAAVEKKTILRIFTGVTEDYSRRIVKMTLEQIAMLGRKLVAFLGLFAGCFGRRESRELLRVYVQGQLSNLHRKTAEGIALEFVKAPRSLQRFLESIKWDEEKLHDRCQQIVARDHSHSEVIGVVDESAVAKSVDDTLGGVACIGIST